MAFREDYARLPQMKYVPHPSTSQRSAICNEHGYGLIASSGDAPRVILLGMTHPEGKIKQIDDLLGLLRQIINTGDVIAIEGARGKITKDTAQEGSLAYRLLQDQSNKDCVLLHNENDRLVARGYTAQYRLKTGLSEYAARAFFENTKARDEAMCMDPEFGLISLAKKGGPSNKVVQIAGIWHVWLKNIETYLIQAQLPYEVYVPKEFVEQRSLDK